MQWAFVVFDDIGVRCQRSYIEMPQLTFSQERDQQYQVPMFNGINLYLAMIRFDTQTILRIIKNQKYTSEGHIDFWIKHITHYKEDGQKYIDFVNYLLLKIVSPIEEVTMNSGDCIPIISKYIEKTSIIESSDLENNNFIDFYEHYKLLKLLKKKLDPEKLNESFINLSRENPSVKVKLIYDIFKNLQYL